MTVIKICPNLRSLRFLPRLRHFQKKSQFNSSIKQSVTEQTNFSFHQSRASSLHTQRSFSYPSLSFPPMTSLCCLPQTPSSRDILALLDFLLRSPQVVSTPDVAQNATSLPIICFLTPPHVCMASDRDLRNKIPRTRLPEQ